MSLTEEQIRESLKQVVDPELFVNIIDLGLVYTVTVAPAQIPAVVETSGETGAATDGNIPAAVSGSDGETTDGESTGTAEKEDVFIEMTMTSPACPAGPQLIGNAKQVVSRLPGVNNVEVRIVMSPPWTPDRMSEDARDQLGIF
jgi:metal-sulfur cluster biosynthetic enzyme